MLDKAVELGADQVILDLEDSVAPSDKVAARANVAAALDGRWGERIVSVRINEVGSPLAAADLDAIVGSERLDTVVVPKVAATGDLDTVTVALERTASSVGLEALIETALGLRDVGAIASTGRLAALVFGPLDMSASLGLGELHGAGAEGYPGDPWHYARMHILVAARAAGVRAVDGPYPLLGDEEGLRRSATVARALGYDAKWVIHPSQIEPVNEIFTPTPEEIERAERVLAAYQDQLGSSGGGSARIGDLMVDEATRKVAVSIVERARSAGLRD